jgi:hypothetical protein
MVREFSELILKPSDCTLAFGVPTSVGAFERLARSPGRRGFASLERFTAEEYGWSVADCYGREAPPMVALGARLENDVTREDFERLLRDQSRPVVVLFAHWEDDQPDRPGGVEFADGLAPLDDVIAAVPESYDGVLDLCVCHPCKLVPRLRQQRPTLGPIRFAESQLTFALWLRLYRVLLHLLAEREITYFDALEETFSGVLDRVATA